MMHFTHHPLNSGPYHDQFTFRCTQQPTADSYTDFSKVLNIESKKRLIEHYNICTDGGRSLSIGWYGPKRYRTGMEKIYCVLTVAFGCDNAPSPSIIHITDYAGGCGYNKLSGAMYGVFYKLGLSLYDSKGLTTAHYGTDSIIPALLRYFFPDVDDDAWHYNYIYQ